MNKNLTIGIILVVVVVAIGLVWLSQQTPQPQMEIENMDQALISPEASPVTSVTPEQGSVKEFTVTGSNFKFAPSQLQVKQGDTVRVTFNNQGGMHDWNLDEFNAHTKVIKAGQQETVEFVASKAGQFEYYCSVGDHRQMGMTGTLVVE